MNNAQVCIQRAKDALTRFSSELGDLSLSGINIDTGDLLGFADLFFDGLLADLMMQSRIKDAQYQIDNAIRKIQSILDRLEE